MPKIICLPFLFYDGMALFPFIFIKSKKFLADKTLLNHEKIHLQQQAELLLVFFYVLYILNYVINLVRFLNHKKAYSNIIFEREAFVNEKDHEYLNKRKPFSFLRYIFPGK